MSIELHTGRSRKIIGQEDSLVEALALANGFVFDPRDPDAPLAVFLFDGRAQQYCGWVSRRTATAETVVEMKPTPRKRRAR